MMQALGEEPLRTTVTAKAEHLRKGLNRAVLRYGETRRISRRNREGAIRFYGMRLTRY